MSRRSVWSAAVLTFAAAFVAAAAFALYLIRPIHVAPVEFDSAASVLHFQRLASGRYLEAWVGATPKPLLTLLFGGLHAIVPDWRPIIWATIAAYATTVGLAAVLTRRLAGTGAAAFAAVALIGSTAWLLDVARGYSVAWAMLGWVVAGLAATAERPRYGLVTFALFLAALARVETFVLIGAAIVGVVVWALRARSGHGTPPPRGAWLLSAAFLALPVMLLHDWLLTGDPFFWLRVSARFSEVASDAVAEQGPLTIAGWLAGRFLELGGFAILSVVGFVLLVRRARWAAALGVLAATAGIAGFIVLLAARGTWISPRYAIPIDLVVLFAAGLGFGAIRAPSLAWPGGLRFGRRLVPPGGPRWRATSAVCIGLVSAVVLWAPLAGAALSDIGHIRTEVRLAQRADLVVPVIRRALAELPGGVDPDTSQPLTPEDPDRIVLLVPPPLRPRLAVDIDVALTRIAGLGPPSFSTPASLVGVPGRIIVHDPRTEGSAVAAAFAALEAPDPTIAGVHLVPLLVDPVLRIWVFQVPLPGAPDS